MVNVEDISRKDLNRIGQILQNYVNTEEAHLLAQKLVQADIIPKLYVYTYVNRIKKEFEGLKVDTKEFEFDELESVVDNIPALKLDFIRNKREVRVVSQFVKRAFDRYGKFCDFDDSLYNGQRKYGNCENEHHEEEEPDNPKKYWLSPVFGGDEETGKYIDEPEWWCPNCCDESEPFDFEINCDMDLDGVGF